MKVLVACEESQRVCIMLHGNVEVICGLLTI